MAPNIASLERQNGVRRGQAPIGLGLNAAGKVQINSLLAVGQEKRSAADMAAWRKQQSPCSAKSSIACLPQSQLAASVICSIATAAL